MSTQAAGRAPTNPDDYLNKMQQFQAEERAFTLAVEAIKSKHNQAMTAIRAIGGQ